MMKAYWFQLNGDIITDAIEYEYEGYIHVELAEHILPAGIRAGWYRWDGESYQFDQELYDAAMTAPSNDA
jgi:hypothetical protein